MEFYCKHGSLSACLGGCSDLLDYCETSTTSTQDHSEQSMDMEVEVDTQEMCSSHIVKKGNARKSHWLLTCYKYVDKLASCSANWDVPKSSVNTNTNTTYTIALYEMYIYQIISQYLCNYQW